MFPNIVICYGEAAIEVKTMAEGILAVTVFCMFGLGFYIANKAGGLFHEKSFFSVFSDPMLFCDAFISF